MPAVIALDQATGKLVWDQAVQPFDPSALLPAGQAKPKVAFQLRAAPLVYDGKVIVGATGFEANRVDDAFVKASIAAGVDVGTAWINANLGRRGFVAALDAVTGAEVWRWALTKENGWEGDYVATAPDGTPLHRDIAAEKACGAGVSQRLGRQVELDLDDPGLRSRHRAHLRDHRQSGARATSNRDPPR